MSNEIQKAKQDRFNKLNRQFDQNMKAFEDLLPEYIKPLDMVKAMLAEFRTNAKLQQCDDRSLVLAMLQCAEMGLMPGSALALVHLVPYGQECKVIPDWRGLLDLIDRSGRVDWIETHVVREGDEFDFGLGDNPFVKHRPALRKKGEKPADFLAVYAVATLNGSSKLKLEVMDGADVDAIRARVRSGTGDSPWNAHFDEMARKTVLKRLAKRLPMTERLARSLAVANHHDAPGMTSAPEPRGIAADVDLIGFEPDGDASSGPIEQTASSNAEALKEKLRAGNATPA